MMKRIRFKKNRNIDYIASEKEIDFLKLIPSLITLIGMSSGLTGILFSMNGEWKRAVVSILIAGVLDGLDGRIARMLNASSLFGAELDSLCDFLNFGIAPPLILYLWSLNGKHVSLIGWGVVLFFAMALVIRLARFNVTSRDPNLGTFYKKFFFGVPSPAAGILLLMPIMLDIKIFKYLNINTKDFLLEIGIYGILIGFLAASRIPTFSFKNIKIGREYIWLVLTSYAAFLAAIAIYPWYILPAIGIIYLCCIPISFLYANKIEKNIKKSEELNTSS